MSFTASLVVCFSFSCLSRRALIVISTGCSDIHALASIECCFSIRCPNLLSAEFSVRLQDLISFRTYQSLPMFAYSLIRDTDRGEIVVPGLRFIHQRLIWQISRSVAFWLGDHIVRSFPFPDFFISACYFSISKYVACLSCSENKSLSDVKWYDCGRQCVSARYTW